MRLYVRHGGDPLLQQQILKPCGCEPFEAVPHHVVVLRLRNAATTAKRSQNLVKYSGLRWQHLIYAADEKRTVLLREHCGMFGRQSKTLFCFSP